MSPENENLMYTSCDWRFIIGTDVTKCRNEGWLFCTLCGKHFCEDHACQHLSAQVDKDALRDIPNRDAQVEELHTWLRGDLDSESKSFFRELSPEQMLDKSEIELRSYFRRLLQEAKRIQREIERRMIYATELTGGPAYRRTRQLSQDAIDQARSAAKSKHDLTPLGLIEREAREQRARERQQRKQQVIQASIALLAEQMKLGNVTIDQIKKMGAKK